MIAQSTLHFISLADLFYKSSHMLKLMREGCSYTYPPLFVARYSFIQLSKLEQCWVKKLAQGFNTKNATAIKNSGPQMVPVERCEQLWTVWTRPLTKDPVTRDICKKGKVSSYIIVQYPILRIAQNVLHFSPWRVQSNSNMTSMGISSHAVINAQNSAYTNIHYCL